MEQSNNKQLLELAQFLRTRHRPYFTEQAGLPNGGRRRTPGLRRGEVALLSDVSVDWYTWLEQARNIQVSAQVLESIAWTLQLDSNECKHLFLLALQQLPADLTSAESDISQTLQSFLDLQGTSPASVTDQRLNIVAWNKVASMIYGNYEAMSTRERNSVGRSLRRMSVNCFRKTGKLMPGTVWLIFAPAMGNSSVILGGCCSSRN